MDSIEVEIKVRCTRDEVKAFVGQEAARVGRYDIRVVTQGNNRHGGPGVAIVQYDPPLTSEVSRVVAVLTGAYGMAR